LQSDINDFIRSFTGTAFTTAPSSSDDQEDEYEQWKKLDPLMEDHPLAHDPFLYWRTIATEFPNLSQMALDILSIPPSSCDCERSFSKLGDMLEPHRSRMRPDIIAALQCTRSWNRNGFIKRRK